MGKSFYWICKNEEVGYIEDWLGDNGGVFLSDIETWQPQVYFVHFEEFGPIKYWDENLTIIHNDMSWKEKKISILNQLRLNKNPGQRIIDNENSPIACYTKPYLKDGKFWTIGELHFTPVKIEATFPGLHKICKSFANWLSKQELIFSNVGKTQVDQYNYFLGGDMGTERRIFAFPLALAGLKKGEYFVDSNVSEIYYEKWLKTLRLCGVDIPKNII